METPVETPSPPGSALLRRDAAVLLVGGALAVAAAVIAATGPLGDRSALLLPLAAVLGTGAAVLAFTRFEVFLLGIVVLRASLDVVSVGSSSVDATGALSVLFIAAALVWMVREGVHVEAPGLGRLVLPFGAFFLAGVLSIAFSEHPLDSALEAVRIGTVVVIVVALGRLVSSPTRVVVLLAAVLASAVVPLAAAALQLMSGGGRFTAEGLSRTTGTFLHPNPFATYLFLILVLIVAVFPHVPAVWRWLTLAPLGLACAGVLLMTYSRGAWIAAGVGIVVVGLLQNRALLWLLLAGAVLVWVTVPSVAVRLSDLTESRAPSGATGNSFSWRLQYWDDVARLQDNPVLGIGLREVELNQEAAKAPHNDFLRVYVETGVLGLVAYGWLLIALFAAGRDALRRAPPGLARGLAVAFVATAAGLVVLSFAANVISQLVILWYFSAIVVLGVAGSRLAAPKPASAP